MSDLWAGKASTASATSEETNPQTTTALATFIATATGKYLLHIFIGATAACILNLERRNAANDGTTWSFRMDFTGATAAPVEYVLRVDLTASERVRLIPDANVTGIVNTLITAEELR